MFYIKIKPVKSRRSWDGRVGSETTEYEPNNITEGLPKGRRRKRRDVREGTISTLSLFEETVSLGIVTKTLYIKGSPNIPYMGERGQNY